MLKKILLIMVSFLMNAQVLQAAAISKKKPTLAPIHKEKKQKKSRSKSVENHLDGSALIKDDTMPGFEGISDSDVFAKTSNGNLVVCHQDKDQSLIDVDYRKYDHDFDIIALESMSVEALCRILPFKPQYKDFILSLIETKQHDQIKAAK